MKHKSINAFQGKIYKLPYIIMQAVAKNTREEANLLEPHRIPHLAAGLLSAGRLWFVSRQNPIKILTASFFMLALSKSVVSVYNCKATKRTTATVMEIMSVVSSLDLGCGFYEINGFLFDIPAVL